MVIKAEVKFIADSKIESDVVVNLSMRKGSTIADMVDDALEKIKLGERFECSSVMYQRKKGKGMVAVDLSSEIKKNGKYSIFLELRYVMPKSPPVSPILKSMHECTERNILFLSETGNGKSTFINAFKNYVTYPSFDDALKAARAGESMFLVPASFSISLNGKHRSVRVGDPDDKNENTTVRGGSATRASATYVFESSVGRLGLVDTPGMGDTEGLDKDKMNVANIVSHLSSIENIHCICILLKPNCPRLTVGFRYCLSELLGHLHKSAVNNIVFCFTGSRGTQYQPGDTLDALRALLAEVEEKYGVKIALTDSTKYCLDNDSFRFLCASANGLQHSESDRQWYEESWNHSVQEVGRLLKHVAGLVAHSTKSTVELNEARRIIEVVSPVLAKISQSIQSNLSALKMREEELQKIDIMQEGVADKLMVPVVTMEVRQLDHPRTVCAAVKHMSTVTGSDGECYLSKVSANMFPNPALEDCEVMNPETGNCMKCGCQWSEHMHIYMESYEQRNMVENAEIVEFIASSNNTKEMVKKAIAILAETKQAYEEERAVINKTGAKFGSFLRRNAIVPWSDVMRDYIRLAIRESQVVAEETGDWSKVEGLYNSLADYESQKKLIEQGNTSDGANADNASSIKAYYDELISLEKCGSNIKKLFENAAGSCEVEFIQHECSVSVGPSSALSFSRPESVETSLVLEESTEHVCLESPPKVEQAKESILKRVGKKIIGVFYPFT